MYISLLILTNYNFDSYKYLACERCCFNSELIQLYYQLDKLFSFSPYCHLIGCDGRKKEQEGT